MIFQEVRYNSEEYKITLELRDLILRKPIGLSVYDDDLEAERDYTIIIVKDHDRIIGTCQFKPINDTTVLMKQVCVLPDQQGKQIGRRMFEYSKNLLKDRGIQIIQIHSRLSAIGYYEKMGFIKSGEQFIEVGIPHQYLEVAI